MIKQQNISRQEHRLAVRWLNSERPLNAIGELATPRGKEFYDDVRHYDIAKLAGHEGADITPATVAPHVAGVLRDRL